MVAMSRLSVNPMPDTVPAPSTAPHPTDGRSRLLLSRVTSQAPPTIPIGLPIT
jgi:hypothetical protein